MRESRVYLKFLKENLLILALVPLTSFACMGYYLYKNPPIKYTYHTQIVAQHDDQNAAARTLMVEEIVSLLRQQPAPSGVKLSIHKASPFTISIKSSASSMRPQLVSAANDLYSFSQSKYPFLEQSAGDAFGKVNYTFIYLFATAGASILLALLLSFVHHYIRYY